MVTSFLIFLMKNKNLTITQIFKIEKYFELHGNLNLFKDETMRFKIKNNLVNSDDIRLILENEKYHRYVAEYSNNSELMKELLKFTKYKKVKNILLSKIKK